MIPGPGCGMRIAPPGPPIIGRGTCIIGAGVGAPKASKLSKSAADRPPAGAAGWGWGCCCCGGGREGAELLLLPPPLLSTKSPKGSASGA